MTSADLVNWIEHMRHINGWTNEELCERAGVAVKTWYDLRRGHRHGRITTILALCNATGLELTVKLAE